MEILVGFLALCLLGAVFKINDMKKEKQILLGVKESLAAAEKIHTDLESEQLRLKASLLEEMNKTKRTIQQYDKLLMIALPRLFYMELAAYIHQQGVVRQTIIFDDERLSHALSTMLMIVLISFEDVEDPITYAKAMVKREHYMDYFKEHVISGRKAGVLRITGQSGYDAINQVIDHILSHGEKGVIGVPQYGLVKKQPIAPV